MTAGTGDTAARNYALFHETASATTITLSTSGSSEQVFGLQIVQTTPEPASLGLLGLAGLGLLARRHRT